MKTRLIDFLKNFLKLFKQTFDEWNQDKAPQLAASLAFYTMFSIAPLLIIAIAVAGAVFGQQAAQDQVTAQVSGLIGQQGAEFIQGMVESANKPSSGGVFATLFSVVTLLLGAAGIFNQIKGMMQTIWEVPPKLTAPGIAGIIQTIREQLLSVGLVLVVGFLLMVSLLLSAVLAGTSAFIGGSTGMGAALLQVLTQVVTFGAITGVFAAMFKYFPGVSVPWRDVLFGAAMTALLFTIGKYLLGVYLGQSATTSSYGAAGSLVVVLLWVYYTAQILFFGAELTQVYSRSRGYYSVIPGLNELKPKYQKEQPVPSVPLLPAPRSALNTPNPSIAPITRATLKPMSKTSSRIRDVLWVLMAPLLFLSVTIGHVLRRRAAR